MLNGTGRLVLLHSAMKNLPLLLQQFSVIVLLINGLVLQHHQVAANSSARLVLRLISYENLANLRISGASCDSMRSPCDPSFDVTASGARPDIRVTSPCLSNEERVYFPDEVSRLPELAKPIKSRDGPMPSWARMRISVWIECSPGFYGRGCDVRCEPQRGCCCDSEGLLRCDETIDCSAQLATKPAFPTSGPGGAGSSNGNSDNRNRDEATSVLFIAVMASSMTSIFILAVIALVAIKMCKASERRQQNHYQLQHQNLGYFNPALVTNLSTIVSTSAVPANNRTDSGVYEDPQEPQ
uniref:Uncharacterized protein n=1 Tax=Macrostomum lignano TaxID=282301 RepID=A0A1I8FGZ1_9PLAT